MIYIFRDLAEVGMNTPKKKKVNKQKTIKGNKNEKKKILTFPHIYSCISRLVCSTLSEKKKKLEKYLLRGLYWLQL